MTRFARAKGSKSSNERAPEDSTPWEVMKEQFLNAKKDSEEAKKRQEAEKQRIENYENFLKEHKSQKRKAVWCDFPEAETNKSINKQPELKKKKKNEQQKLGNGTVLPTFISNAAEQNDVPTTEIKKSKKKKQSKQKSEKILSSSQENQKEDDQPVPNREKNEADRTLSLKKKKKLKKVQNPGSELETPQNVSNSEQTQHLSQNKKNKIKKKNKNKKVDSEDSAGQNNENNISANQFTNPNPNSHQPKKDKKMLNGVPVRRKPINDHSFQLIINGKEVELVRFDGFPIMKRDAERLEELKNNMIKKGIPKSEVNRTLKLERRRAEKALARLKRDVCYNCRKGGHNLSDCPELKTKIPGVGAPDGVCFKCGSTEHRQFECKVQKDKEFKFATCFICKEPGHIARQCPDNPKGLYPNGGGCKLCGDVTHLRKDCPTLMGKKEETSFKLQTLESTVDLEGIDQKMSTAHQETIKKPKKIKF